MGDTGDSTKPLFSEEDFESEVYRSRKRILFSIFSQYDEKDDVDYKYLKQKFTGGIYYLPDADVKHIKVESKQEFETEIDNLCPADDLYPPSYTAEWYDYFFFVFLCDLSGENGNESPCIQFKGAPIQVKDVETTIASKGVFDSKPKIFLFQANAKGEPKELCVSATIADTLMVSSTVPRRQQRQPRYDRQESGDDDKKAEPSALFKVFVDSYSEEEYKKIPEISERLKKALSDKQIAKVSGQLEGSGL